MKIRINHTDQNGLERKMLLDSDRVLVSGIRKVGEDNDCIQIWLRPWSFKEWWNGTPNIVINLYDEIASISSGKGG